MSGGVRELATVLASLSDDALSTLFAVRGVRPDAPWRDFFDAADALTSDGSVRAALAALPAAALSDLETGEGATGRDLGLTDASGAPLDAVRSALREFSQRETPRSGADIDTSTAPRLAPDDAPRVAERAFAALSDLAGVLLRTERAPLALIGSGALAASDRKPLSDELQRPESIDDLLLLADAAALTTRAERRITTTPQADHWLTLDAADRWLVVANAWARRAPAALFVDRVGHGSSSTGSPHPVVDLVAVDEWPGLYPADPTWPERAARLRSAATTWGIVDATGARAPWAETLTSHDAELAVHDTAPAQHPASPSWARETLTALLPADVDRIYLQNDLTAIAPGPLRGDLDARLRRLARRESHAQASTYRFTPGSIAEGLGSGETEASVLEFLAAISITGVPQPLDYVVRQAAARFGSVRVRVDTATGRTRIESDDAGILDQIAVDQSLRPLGIVDDEDALATRVGRDATLWALRDARYPAIALGRDGEIVRTARSAGAPTVAPAPDFRPLIARLRGADTADADTAWLERELDAAVRARSELDVDVELPGGEIRTFRLEAAGIGGGRLRGKDLSADVERTVPLSSIRAVRAR